jgi:hypothetical protein
MSGHRRQFIWTDVDEKRKTTIAIQILARIGPSGRLIDPAERPSSEPGPKSECTLTGCGIPIPKYYQHEKTVATGRPPLESESKKKSKSKNNKRKSQSASHVFVCFNRL